MAIVETKNLIIKKFVVRYPDFSEFFKEMQIRNLFLQNIEKMEIINENGTLTVIVFVQS